MKFIAPISSLLLLATTAISVRVTFDPVYDNSNGDVNTVSCSNVLTGRGFATFGDVPNFPFIGGAPNVTFNSPLCLSCWSIVFNDTTIHLVAIDSAAGFNIAQEAMDVLTHNQSVQLGGVDAVADRVDAALCGL